jgi:palmitoyltransferase
VLIIFPQARLLLFLLFFPYVLLCNSVTQTITDTDAPHHESWPPRDPTTIHNDDPDKEFVLPASPWTYENGTLNPELQPSNSVSHRRNKNKNTNGASALPPYHPDYQPPTADESSDDEVRYRDDGKPRVRRGSEGYEVRPAGRENMLARYLQEIGETPQKYHRYIPQVSSDSEEVEEDEEDDDVPLAQQLHT